MSADPEFANVLEAWAESGEERARREHLAQRAAELAAPHDPQFRRADRWARLTTFVPYSSMPFEEEDTDALPADQRS